MSFAPCRRFRAPGLAAGLAAVLLVAALPAAAQNLVRNPSFESSTTGWGAYGGATITRVPGGRDSAWALEMRGPATVTTFGVNDSPNWIATSAGVGARYRFRAWVRSDSSQGSARLQVREYQGGVQRGSTAKSPLVRLSPEWQPLAVEYVVTTAGSTLDLHVLDLPAGAHETFQVDDVSITIDAAPVVTAPESVAAAEGEPLEIVVTAADADGPALASLAADLAGLPAGSSAVFTPAADHASGTLRWTPGFDAAGGPYLVTFTAANSRAGSASTAITVANHDRAPAIAAPDTAPGIAGRELVVAVQAWDPDGEPIAALDADLSGLPAGHDAIFESDSSRSLGTLRWTPRLDDVGLHAVVLEAANAMVGRTTVLLRIAPPDRAPVVAAPETVLAAEGEPLAIAVAAADPDGDAILSLTADLSGLPPGAAFAADSGNASGTLAWTPSFDDAGSWSLTVTAANALSGSSVTTIMVEPRDRAPQVSAPAQVAGTDSAALTVEVTAADPDGEPIVELTADLSALPPGSGATFEAAPDGASGTLSWTPALGASGSFPVTFVAVNGGRGEAVTVIEIARIDHAPTVAAPVAAVTPEGVALAIAVAAADPDGDPIASLTADLSALPAGHDAVFDAAADGRSGTLRWTPGPGQAGGPYVVGFNAANGLAGSAAAAITVRPPNHAPEARLAVSPNPASVSLAVVADAAGSADPDDAALSYTFDFGDGTIVGPQSSPVAVSAYAATGVHQVTVTVTDPWGAADTAHALVRTDLGNLCVNPGFENTTAGWTAYGGAALSRVAGAGRRGGVALQATRASGSGWGVNDSPDWVPLTAGAGRVYRVSAWMRSLADTGRVHLRVQEFLGTVQKGATALTPRVAAGPEWRHLTLDYRVAAAGTRLDLKVIWEGSGTNEKLLLDDVQVTLLPAGDSPPVVMAPAWTAAAPGRPMALRIAARDPDGEPVTALTASLAGLPPGHDAAFVPDPDLAGGLLTWTPAAGDVSPVPYRVVVTAANARAASAPVEIVVADPWPTNLCANPGFEVNASGWSPYGAGSTITRVNSGRSGRFAIQVANASGSGWGVNDQLDIVSTTAGPGRTYRYSAWVRSATSSGRVRMRVQEFLNGVQKGVTAESPEVTLGPEWQRLAVSATVTTPGTRLDMKIVDTPVAGAEAFLVDDVEVLLLPAGDRPPAMTAPAALTAVAGEPTTVSVTVVDPDGDPIPALAADLSGLPAGHGATFAPGPGNQSGILSWTPGAGDARAEPWVVTFTAANSKTALAATSITVAASAPPNLCANPGFESGTSGWGSYGGASIARVADAHGGAFGLRMTSAGASSFGCDDVPNAVASADSGARYRFAAWVRSAASTSPVKLRVYEFVGTTQIGPVAHSQEIPLSTTWQRLSVDVVAQRSGSTLSLRVTTSPVAAGQSFVVDDVSIQRLPAGAALLAGDPGAAAVVAVAAGAPIEPQARAESPAPGTEGSWTVRIEGLDALLEGGMPEVALERGGAVLGAARLAAGEDADRNGAEELAAEFPAAAARALLAAEPEGGAEATVVVRRGTAVERLPLSIEIDAGPVVFAPTFAPNPMSGTGALSFALGRGGALRVELFDAAGRRVRTLADRADAPPGRHRLELRSREGGARLASGLYFYRIAAAEGVRRGRIVVLD